MATNRDILERALELVRDGGWTKKASARDSRGRFAQYNSSKASSWCVAGVIARAADDLHVDLNFVRYVLLVARVHHDAISWNDAPERTVDDVIEAFKEAIVDCPLEEGT